MPTEISFFTNGAGTAPPAQARETLAALVMAWATDAVSGHPVYILELDASRNGQRCGCICPDCGEPLIAANAGKEAGTYLRRPHFRHRAGAQRDTCLTLAARSAALRVLVESGYIDLPARTRRAERRGYSGEVYEAHARREAQRLRVLDLTYRDRACAVLTLDDGREVVVDLLGSARPGEDGAPSAPGAMLTLALDDPMLAGLDPQQLRERLRLMPSQLCWQQHWADADLDASADIDALALARAAVDLAGADDDLDLAGVPDELRRETLLHLTVKNILAEAKRLEVPAFVVQASVGRGLAKGHASRELIEAGTLELRRVRLEQRLGSLVPDVSAVCSHEDGTPYGVLCVEVTVTNGVDAARLERIAAAGHLAIEIDLSTLAGRMSLDALRSLVVDRPDSKRWLHHPQLPKIRDELSARALEESQRLAAQLQAMSAPVAVAAPRAGAHINVERLGLPADLTDGLRSLQAGRGVGVHDGLQPAEVAHRMRCALPVDLHCIALAALSHHGARSPDDVGPVHTEWADITRQRVREMHGAWLPSPEDLDEAEKVAPELVAAIAKLRGYVRRAGALPRWTPPGTPTPPASKVTLARLFYKDGAYRMFGAKIDYPSVLDQARQARASNRPIAPLLETFAAQYSLGEDLKPITDVLRAAGLITLPRPGAS